MNLKFSQMDPAGPLTGSEYFPLLQAGGNVIDTLANLLAFISANSPTTLADILTNGNTTGGFDFYSENGWAKVSAIDIKAALEWNDGTNNGFVKANPYKTEMGHNILNQFNAPINQFVGNIEFNGTYSLDVKATAGSDVLNIGTTNADVINIGNSSSTINFLGTALYEYAANQYVLDKLITLNYNGASASGVGSGFEIEEGGSITGYLKTNGARNAFSIKVPGIFYYSDLSLFKLSDNRTHYLPDFDGDLLSAGGTYSNPSWLTTLAFSKITSKPTTLSGYGITDAESKSSKLLTGGAITIGNYDAEGTNNDVRVEIATWYIVGYGNCSTVANTDFLNITLSSAGLQRYIGFYGTTSNTITKVEGTESEYAATPTQPAGTALIGYILVTDSAAGTAPDLSPYALINPRVLSITSSAAPAYDISQYDELYITALAADINLSTNLTGTVGHSKQFIIHIKDNSVARLITMGTKFATKYAALPTTTQASKWMSIGCKWNSNTSKFDVWVVSQEA